MLCLVDSSMCKGGGGGGAYANMSVQYTTNCSGCKNDSVQIKCMIFFLNIDCGCMLERTCNHPFEAVLMSTHNLF